MKNFKKLNIWKKGINLVFRVYKLTNNLPIEEKYGLKSQINRCVISIPANIAEGSSRNSEKEYKRFIEISLGSIYELETLLIILKIKNTLKLEI